jgi:Asp-tRNA(Asn)/Glu-tRNA(Gln) amidotransferase A subunit family amidase
MGDQTQEQPWKDIARRKQKQRAAAIPDEWEIEDKYLPKDDGSRGNVLSTPEKCGILTPREVKITSYSTATALLQAIHCTHVTTHEVALAFCKRAAIAQQLTNCITEPLFNSALDRAQYLDDYLAKNGKLFGPLHGLPISLKDTFRITGVDSSIGLAALCFKPASSNSPLVDLLLSLGCVLIAKTNVPQTLASLDSINNVFGRTMNPSNRLVTAGGSSGGEGVLVAMRGSMIGVGTDIGGSIRIPAMCNGVYGFKPSVGRVPHGGQEFGGVEGTSRISVQTVTGPIARSVADLDLFMREVVPRAEMWGEDCLPGSWPSGRVNATGNGKSGGLVIGLLRSDGNCEPLPPIMKVLEEVKDKLEKAGNFKVIDLPTPPAWTECQSLMNKLMGAEGASTMANLLEETREPLVPWMQGRFRRAKPTSFEALQQLQAKRSKLERQMMDIWYASRENGSRERKLDAVICPVAPHPVPPIDGWNAVGYTSSFVLLDYPAGVIPVRTMQEEDLELGKEIGGRPLGSWDERNRQLWNEKVIDRKVYLGTPLSIQLVTPKLHDFELCNVMRAIDRALDSSRRRESKL